MKISELAKRAGVPLSAVKFYQREGLLHEGERRAANQTSYDETHVQRVRLVRALLTTGGLSIAAARRVIDGLREVPLAKTFEIAQHSMAVRRTKEAPPSEATRDRVLEIARARGWNVTEDNPGIEAAAYALDGFAAIDFHVPDRYLEAYAAAAARVAAADLQALSELSGVERIAEVMAVGTVLGDPLFAGLRRLAHQDATHDLFPDQQGSSS